MLAVNGQTEYTASDTSPTISSYGWEESEGCWEHSGSLLPEHHLLWVGLVWPEEPSPEATGAVEHSFPSGDRPVLRVYVDAFVLSRDGPALPHPAGTHTDEACSGTNWHFLAYNEGTKAEETWTSFDNPAHYHRIAPE